MNKTLVLATLALTAVACSTSSSRNQAATDSLVTPFGDQFATAARTADGLTATLANAAGDPIATVSWKADGSETDTSVLTDVGVPLRGKLSPGFDSHTQLADANQRVHALFSASHGIAVSKPAHAPRTKDDANCEYGGYCPATGDATCTPYFDCADVVEPGVGGVECSLYGDGRNGQWQTCDLVVSVCVEIFADCSSNTTMRDGELTNCGPCQ